MVAVPLPNRADIGQGQQHRHQLSERRAHVAQRRVQRQQRSLELLQGSLSARRVQRQAPWLVRLHRVADGALVATGVAALGLTALTLHWQGRWSSDYRDLQDAQQLEHRVMESRSSLEKHYLSTAARPGKLVPTQSKDLIFLPSPPTSVKRENNGRPLQFESIASGY